MNEHDLRTLGEQIRDEIINLPSITQVALQAVRPYEISIEVSEETLQQYGLTLEGIAQAIRFSSIDLPFKEFIGNIGWNERKLIQEYNVECTSTNGRT